MISRGRSLYRYARIARNASRNLMRRRLDIPLTAFVHPSADLDKQTSVAPYVFIGPECQIPALTSVGKYTMLASEVAIVGLDHRTDVVGTPMQFTGRPQQRPTTIEDDVWIGHRATLLRGITVGRGAIIAAGAVVTRNVPPYEIWAGIPAKYLHRRFDTHAMEAAHSAALNRGDITVQFADPRGSTADRVTHAGGKQHAARRADSGSRKSGPARESLLRVFRRPR